MNKKNLIGMGLALLASLALAQQPPANGISPLKNDREKASYAFGMNIGRGWNTGHVELGPGAFARGLKDSLGDGGTLLTDGQMTEALARFNRNLKQPPQQDSGQPAADKQSTVAGSFKNENDQAGYAFGMNIGWAWKQGGADLDPDLAVRGLRESLAGGGTLLTEAEMTGTLAQFGRDLRAIQQERREKDAEENSRRGAAFLAQNSTNQGVVSLPGGLQYKIIVQGTGQSPDLTNWVNLKFRGTRINGSEFDVSDPHPEARIFSMRGVMQGWQEALQLMKPGAKWRLFVPPSLAYGSDGSPTAGPNDTRI